ncbi:YraN family protein [Egicoccus halophilus]|uniref:UPF0102 protein GCM10011354_19340 n=1 Tax=Egicoccus halophilus TaxID=1670830 RepID=A0A8J3AF86_9ACTN|nr:YraN family protein [Egicoccus halophilus]GGI06488.1 UPF0102 protein [Egicoccus halophilus]
MDTNGTCTRPLPATALAGGTRALGRLGEDLAAQHLQADDRLEIVARNWRLSAGELRGELDLVALDHRTGTVVVCEVKTRRDAQHFGGALQAVGPRKRARLRALTGAFLCEAGLGLPHARIDLVAVDLGRHPVLHHVRDAL